MYEQPIAPREIAVGDRTGERLGKGLGYLSIGLGLAELIAPRAISSLVGVRPAPIMMRALGARELATGAGILVRPSSSIGAWARVVGDVLDLALLGIALGRNRRRRVTSRRAPARTLGAIALVAGVMAVDVYAGTRQARRQLRTPVRRAVTIARPPHEVYAMFRGFERLPEFMTWIESVRDLGDGMSHWTVNTPAGVTVEYDAELVEDIPNRRLAWRSLPGADVPNRGSVTFLDAPGGRGTEVVVELQVAAPLGKTIAGGEAMGDLRRLKQLLETGEIVKSDASIHKGPHAAQPSGMISGGQS